MDKEIENKLLARKKKQNKAIHSSAKKAVRATRRVRKHLNTSVSKAGKIKTEEEVASLPKQARVLVEENVLFKPNAGPQTDFLASPETDVLYGGAAGGGKSYAMIVDPLRYAHNKNHRALLLRKSMPELRELIDNTRELYPKAFPGARFKEQEKTWIFPSGAKLEFGFLDKEADVYRYQGQQYSWIGFDEITHLLTEFPWQYLGSRLRTTDPSIEVYMRATANPGGPGHNWVKERYINPSPANTSFIGKDGISRRFIPALLKDNPYLYTDGRYERMLEGLDEITKRRLLNGDWNINEGVAFPEFNRDLHVIEPFEIPQAWFRFKGADYGYTSPSAVLWFAVDPEDNTIICYRELYEKGLTGSDLADKILDLEMNELVTIAGVLDTAAWNKTGYTGPTIGQELNQKGCKFRPADKNRIGGKVQIHERLKLADTGRPKLQFFSTCKNIIRELETLPVSDNNSEDVNTHASDHAYDALRYAIMSRPKMTTLRERLGVVKRETYIANDSIFGY